MKKLKQEIVLILCLLFLTAHQTAARWVKMRGPQAEPVVSKLVGSGGSLFGLVHDGILRSTDSGVHWSKVYSDTGAIYNRSLDVSGSTIFTRNFLRDPLVFSTDGGNTWTTIDSVFKGLRRVRSVSVGGGVIFAANDTGTALISIDGGTTWETIFAGFTTKEVTAFTARGDTLFAGTGDDGIFISEDGGRTWAPLYGIDDINALVICDTALLAGTSDGVYTRRAAYGGGGGTRVLDGNIKCLAMSGSAIIAGTSYTGMYRSTDGGAHWTAADSGLPASPNNEIYSLVARGKDIFAATEVGLFLSNDNGVTWTAAPTGFPAECYVHTVAGKGAALFAGTDKNGVFLSADSGVTWKEINNGITYPTINGLAPGDGMVVAGTSNGVFRSIDNGTTWTALNTGLTQPVIRSIAMNRTTIYAVTRDSGLFRFDNSGTAWTAVDVDTVGNYFEKIAADGDSALYLSGRGMYVSTDNGKIWVQYPTEGESYYWTEQLAVGDSAVFVTSPISIIKSVDRGASWGELNTRNIRIPEGVYNSLAVIKHTVFAGTSAGIILSNDNGKTWSAFNAGFTGLDTATTSMTYVLGVFGGYVFAGDGGLWRRPLSDTAAIVLGSKYPPAPAVTGNYRYPVVVYTAGRIIVEFSIGTSQQVVVDLYDLSGKVVTAFVNKTCGPGFHRYSRDLRDVPPGCYMVKMRSGSVSSVKNIAVFR